MDYVGDAVMEFKTLKAKGFAGVCDNDMVLQELLQGRSSDIGVK